MKKFILAAALAVGLVACGGGGLTQDIAFTFGDPIPLGSPAQLDYSQYDGKYFCTNSDKPKQTLNASLLFTGITLVATEDWKDDNGVAKQTSYNNSFERLFNLNGLPAYTQRRPDLPEDTNAFWFDANKQLNFSVGPYPVPADNTHPVGTYLFKYYVEKVWKCTKV